MEVSNGHCNNCNKNVKMVAKPVNHILHLALSFLTAGFWLIVWIIIAVAPNDWKCDICGNKIPNKVFNLILSILIILLIILIILIIGS